jgi:hypothetical protein
MHIYGIVMEAGGWPLTEKFSTASTLRREKMRIISGITAFNLIHEGKFEQAEVYRRSLVEIKDYPIDDVAHNFAPGFLPNEEDRRRIAEQLLEIAALISQDPHRINKSDINKSNRKLVELLNVISRESKL